MKKQYIAPQMVVVEVAQNEVICTSAPIYGGYGNGIPAEAPEMRRRGTGWDDYEN